MLMIFVGCKDEQLPALDFFNTTIDSVRVGTDFGSAIVYSKLATQASSEIREYGVRWSTKANFDETELLGKISKMPFKNSFQATYTLAIPNLSLDTTYFFQAYAEHAEGRVSLSRVTRFSLGITLKIKEHEQINDTLLIRTEVNGLKYFGATLNLREFGLLIEEELPNRIIPAFVVKVPIERVADGVFNFKIPSIRFNQQYLLSLYAQSAARTWSSDKNKIRTGGGWKKLPDLDQALFGAAAIGLDNSLAISGFGYASARDLRSTSQLRIFNPATSRFSSKSNPGILPRLYPVVWNLKGRVFCGLGEYQAPDLDNVLCDLYEFDRQSQQFIEYSTCIESGKRSNAVAFCINEKAYVGLGTRLADNRKIFLNDFWEFDPEANEGKGRWREITALPSRDGNEIGNEGRQFAYFFQFKNRVFVGGGSYSSKYLLDIWEFIPPRNSNDPGDWHFIGFFPGLPRDKTTALTLESKGYLLLGEHNVQGEQKDVWEFNPNATSSDPLWKKLPNFPGTARASSMAFALNDQFFIGGGITWRRNGVLLVPDYPRDFWQYVPTRQ
jgi:N-acetylneuraminic acid mutarotase